jgi:hypothetical protein
MSEIVMKFELPILFDNYITIMMRILLGFFSILLIHRRQPTPTDLLLILLMPMQYRAIALVRLPSGNNLVSRSSPIIEGDLRVEAYLPSELVTNFSARRYS